MRGIGTGSKMNGFKTIFNEIKKDLTAGQAVAALIAAVVSVSFLFSLITGKADLSLADSVFLPLFIMCVLAVIFILMCLSSVFHTRLLIPAFLFGALLLYFLFIIYKNGTDVWYASAMCISSAGAAYFLAKNIPVKGPGMKGYRIPLIFAVILFVLMTAMLSYVCIMRYRSYNAPTYDFGIFAQLFSRMAKTGLPFTTLERSVEMSHFSIHFSPFFYVLLPFYMIKPGPETLLVIQAAGIFAGVFPVYLICRHMKISPAMTMLWEAVYALYPTLTASGMTDFHENKFLPALILFLLYFILKEKTVSSIVFTILVLSVKEDCAIYICAIALWMFFTGRNKRTAVIMFITAVVWFAAASAFISASGPGIMTSRYKNYYTEAHRGSLFEVFRNIFISPGYFLSQLFTAEKAVYLIYMLMPMMLMPLKQHKAGNYLLFLPLLLENLMPSWQYQYDIEHQYSYGSGALLIFLALMMLNENGRLRQRFFTLAALACSAILFLSPNIKRFRRYTDAVKNGITQIEATDKCLERLPEGTVLAGSRIASHLWDRDTVYPGPPVYYENEFVPDIVVVDLRYHDDAEKAMEYVMEGGYSLYDRGGYAEVYIK